MNNQLIMTKCDLSLLQNTFRKCSNCGCSSFIIASALSRQLRRCRTPNSFKRTAIQSRLLSFIGAVLNTEINPLIGRVTLMLERWSWEVMWACTEDADEVRKTLHAAQRNISTLVMWSFSWRATVVAEHRSDCVWPVSLGNLKKVGTNSYLPWSTLSSMGRLHCRLLYSMASCAR